MRLTKTLPTIVCKCKGRPHLEMLLAFCRRALLADFLERDLHSHLLTGALSLLYRAWDGSFRQISASNCSKDC
jgi:hypothetical protein